MIKTYRIIPLVFILFFFGFTLITVAPVFAQTVDQLIERIEKLEAAVFPEGRTGPPPPPMGAPGMPPGPPPHMPPTRVLSRYLKGAPGMPPMGMNPGMPGGPGGMPPTGMPPTMGAPGMPPMGNTSGFVPPPMPPEVKKCNMMPPGPDKSRCFQELPCDLGNRPPEAVASCERNKARMHHDGGPPPGAPGMPGAPGTP